MIGSPDQEAWQREQAKAMIARVLSKQTEGIVFVLEVEANRTHVQLHRAEGATIPPGRVGMCVMALHVAVSDFITGKFRGRYVEMRSSSGRPPE